MGSKIARWRRTDWWDVGLAVLLAAAALIESRQPGRTYSHPAVMTTCSLLMTFPLSFRRRAPVPVALFIAAVAVVEALAVRVPASAVLFLAALVAIYTVVTVCGRRSWLLVIGLGLVAATVTEVRDPANHSLFEALPAFAVIGAVVVLAVVVRRSREQSARLQGLAVALADSRAEAEELAKAGERLRIAREMHDVLAHSVSVMVLQTGAARMALHENEPHIRDLLAGIEDVGRDALAELRSILGVLRGGAAAVLSPGMQVDHLAQTMRSAGSPVHLDIQVNLQELPGPVAAAVVRVVQEGLTNALKHGGGPAAVHIRSSRTDVDVRIASGDPLAGGVALPVGGHGLLGLTERVHDIGGTVQAGPAVGGGWELRASIPVVAPGVVISVAS